MDGIRVGDNVASVPLAPMDDTRLARVLAGETIGGRNIAGLREYRGAQINLAGISVATGGGGDTLDVTFEESDPPKESDNRYPYDGTDDGSLKLRDGAASNIQIAQPFTTTKAQTIYSVKLQLSKLGTPAGGLAVIWVTIETDAAGDPSGVIVGGKSRNVLATGIATSRGEITFYFDVGVDLANATDYWVVLSGDYTVSATNCIQWHYDTVAGTSGCKFYDAAWAASVNTEPWYTIQYLEYTTIAGVAHTQLVEPWEVWLNAIGSNGATERLEVDLRLYKDVIRAKYAGAGTAVWTIGHTLTIGGARHLPVV